MVAHYAAFCEGGVHSILSNLLFNTLCRLASVFFLPWCARYATFYDGGVHSILSNSLFNIVCRLALVLISMVVWCIFVCRFF